MAKESQETKDYLGAFGGEPKDLTTRGQAAAEAREKDVEAPPATKVVTSPRETK